MHDLETTARIHDPTDQLSKVSVRVLFTCPTVVSRDDIHVYGVFLQSDDSEIDFKTLPLDDQDTIIDQCYNSLKRQ